MGKNKLFYRYLFFILFLIFCTLPGCAQNAGLNKAKEYQEESLVYYQKSLAVYKDLINRGGDLDRLYLELGKLYFTHGDFNNALNSFRKSGNSVARKLEGISDFRMGNFTDALEIFNKFEIV